MLIFPKDSLYCRRNISLCFTIKTHLFLVNLQCLTLWSHVKVCPYVNLSQETGSTNKTIQSGTGVSSRAESIPEDEVPQTGPTELTPVQTGRDTRKADRSQNGDTGPRLVTVNGHPSNLQLWSPSTGTVQNTKQDQQPFPAAKSDSSDAPVLESDETAIVSPDFHAETPTAPGVTSRGTVGQAETASTHRSFSNGPQNSDFGLRSSLGTVTESGAVTSSPSPDEGVREKKLETSPLAITPQVSAETQTTSSRQREETASPSKPFTEDLEAPRTHQSQDLTKLTPTLQSREDLHTRHTEDNMTHLSISPLKDKKEKDITLEPILLETETSSAQPLPKAEQENRAETDADDMDVLVEEDVEGNLEIQKETHESENDTSKYSIQSSSDWVPDLPTVDSLIQTKTVKAASQSPPHTAKHERTTLRPGIRGQRVRYCLHLAVSVLRPTRQF